MTGKPETKRLQKYNDSAIVFLNKKQYNDVRCGNVFLHLTLIIRDDFYEQSIL